MSSYYSFDSTFIPPIRSVLSYLSLSKKSLTEQPALPLEAHAQAHAQDDAQAQDEAHEDAHEDTHEDLVDPVRGGLLLLCTGTLTTLTLIYVLGESP